MGGFAFQVDRLASVIEDHQLLHELSLEDEVLVEQLPRELDLSAASTESSMSGVAPLPPDPVSFDPVVESSVAQLPPDGLDFGEVDSVPIPTACSMPTHSSAPPASSVPRTQFRLNISICSSIHQKFFSEHHSDSSCSESSMEEGQPPAPEGLGEPVVVVPDSQTVESVAPCSTPAASPVDFTEAVASSSSGSVVQLPPTSSPDVEKPPQTPQCIPPSSPQEAASSDVLGEAGRLEDPASTIPESAVKGSPSSLTALSLAIPGVLSAPLGSNHAPEGGEADSSEAVDDRPASTEGSGSGQDSLTEVSRAGHSPDSKGMDVGTHPSSPIVGVILSTPGSPAAGSTAASSLRLQDSSLPLSMPASPMKQSPDSSHSSPALLSSPERPMDQPRVVEKLAPASLPLPESGRLSPSEPFVSVASSELPPPTPVDGSPDCAELSQDSFVQLQTGAGTTSKVRGEEDGADLSRLDISLEGGVQVPMDHPVLEQLCDAAAREVTIWDQCLRRMTINEHPDCEFPHIYGIRNNMEFYHKTEIPEKRPFYDEFHDALLRNDLTEYDVNAADPFMVHYVLAHLLHSDHSLPEELLPAMEAHLKWHRSQIANQRAEKIESIKGLDSRLEKLSEPEAAPDVAEGNIVPSHWESDSSFRSEEPKQPDPSFLATEEVKTEEALEVKVEESAPEPVKLEDQLLLPFAERSAPDCDDYPWIPPRFSVSGPSTVL